MRDAIEQASGEKYTSMATSLVFCTDPHKLSRRRPRSRVFCEMVQKSAPADARPTRKRRGRPRAYDPETALQNAIDVFWQTGYSGTSLDDLSAATGMNRPSLYAAFGDKRALYLKALDHYWTLGHEAMREALSY